MHRSKTLQKFSHRRINDKLPAGKTKYRPGDADRIFGSKIKKKETGNPAGIARFTRIQHLTTRDENHAPSVARACAGAGDRWIRGIPVDPLREDEGGERGVALARSSREPEVAVKNFPVDVWWPVYEARTAHFAVFGVSGVVHQRVYRGLGHGGMSSQRCWTRGRRGEARGRGAGRAGERAMRSAPSVEGAPRGEARGRSEVAVVVAVGG